MECTSSEFSDNTKLGGVVDAPGSCVNILRDFDRLYKWADRRSFMKFNNRKFNKFNSRVQHMGIVKQASSHH